MKTYILVILCMSLLCVNNMFAQSSGFMVQINSAWQARNHDQILQLATTESVKNPPNPEAFAVLYGYYVLVVGNNQQAAQQLNQLIAVLQSTKPTTVSAVQQYREQFLAIPNAGTGTAPTVAQLNAIHASLPNEFPVKSLLAIISGSN